MAITEHFDCIQYLAQKAYEQNAYVMANPAAPDLQERDALSDQLHDYISALTSAEFQQNTAKFNAVKGLLDSLNTQLQNQLDALNNAANEAANIATILKLIDQCLVIAAGVASKA